MSIVHSNRLKLFMDSGFKNIRLSPLYGYFYQKNGPLLKFTSRITGITGDICGVIFFKVDHENS